MQTGKARSVEVMEDEPGMLLGGLILATLLAPPLYNVLRHIIDRSAPTEYGPVFGGLYIIFLGSIFLASYYFSHKSFLFRAFCWFCEHGSFPSTRKMAFFYAGLCYVMGSMSIINS